MPPFVWKTAVAHYTIAFCVGARRCPGTLTMSMVSCERGGLMRKACILLLVACVFGWFAAAAWAADTERGKTKKPTSIAPEPEKIESLWKLDPPKISSKTAFTTTKLDFLPDTVARWADHTVTGAQIKDLLLPVLAKNTSSGRIMGAKELQTLAYQTAQSIVEQQLLKDKCARDGYKPETDAAVKRVGEQEKQLSPEKFAVLLAQNGETKDSYTGRMAEELMINRWIQERIVPGIEVDDAALQKFYDDSKERFKAPAMARVAHILIKVEPGASVDLHKQAKAKVAQLLDELKKGADFAKLAQENSADTSRDRGGDVGFFTKGQMPLAFEEAAFKLKKDELSDIVATDFGYHILKGIDVKVAGVLPLADVKDQIKTMVAQKQASDVVRKQLNYMRQEQRVEFFLPAEAAANP